MSEVVSKAAIKETDVEVSPLVFLRMARPNVLIVGGGNVAMKQLEEIIGNDVSASVTVVAAQVSKGIKALAAARANITIRERAYYASDVQNADVVFITVGSTDTFSEVENDAINQGLTNIPIIQSRQVLPASEQEMLNQESNRKENRYKKIASYAVAVFGIMLLGHFILSYLPFSEIKDQAVVLYRSLDSSFLVMLAAGFIAQMVDGALGMGYGVASTTILLSAGVNPAAISGSIHTAEMFASGASGYSHYKFGNVNKKLFKKLLIPGVLGAIAGALLLVFLGEKYGNWVKPILAVYTMFLGIKILINAFKKTIAKKKFKNYRILAGTGGFFDSFGGGGWGPIVTTTLITKGRSPKYVIGSVSLTEFFVTLASALTFFVLLGVSHWQTILGLILGGLLAAPLAARLAGKLPRKTALILVGVLVIVWSMRILVKLL